MGSCQDGKGPAKRGGCTGCRERAKPGGSQQPHALGDTPTETSPSPRTSPPCHATATPPSYAPHAWTHQHPVEAGWVEPPGLQKLGMAHAPAKMPQPLHVNTL